MIAAFRTMLATTTPLDRNYGFTLCRPAPVSPARCRKVAADADNLFDAPASASWGAALIDWRYVYCIHMTWDTSHRLRPPQWYVMLPYRPSRRAASYMHPYRDTTGIKGIAHNEKLEHVTSWQLSVIDNFVLRLGTDEDNRGWQAYRIVVDIQQYRREVDASVAYSDDSAATTQSESHLENGKSVWQPNRLIVVPKCVWHACCWFISCQDPQVGIFRLQYCSILDNNDSFLQ